MVQVMLQANEQEEEEEKLAIKQEEEGEKLARALIKRPKRKKKIILQISFLLILA